MKFESIILAGLFAACFALCSLVMGAMLTVTPSNVKMANSRPSTTQPATPASCAPAQDAAHCPRA
jgi:hypothetical protein